MKVEKENYHVLKARTPLHRIHPQVFGATQFNASDKGTARFSPTRDSIIPTIYAEQSFECATCEIILRYPDAPPRVRTSVAPPDIVYPADYRLHADSEVRTTQNLKLVSITATGQRKFNISANGLLAGPRSTYAITRSWAERIHATWPSAQGLHHISYQYGPEFACCSLAIACPAISLKRFSTRSVANPVCHAEIQKIADTLSIDYEDV